MVNGDDKRYIAENNELDLLDSIAGGDGQNEDAQALALIQGVYWKVAPDADYTGTFRQEKTDAGPNTEELLLLHIADPQVQGWYITRKVIQTRQELDANHQDVFAY